MTDLILHILGGAILALLGAFLPWPVGVVLLVLVLGYARELEQHDCAGGSRWDFLGLSFHKHLEAVAWGFGAVLAVIFGGMIFG